MGPIVLFDKSFLQSLSVDESVWFDNFFYANVCPLFYAETLADLEKSVKNGRTPEQEVGLIAEKFPEISGTPSQFHLNLCISNLLGYQIPMIGRIPIVGGHPFRINGKTGMSYGLFPESEAFYRWQQREFLEIERLYARAWREALSFLDLEKITKTFEILEITGKSCKSLEDAKLLAERVVKAKDKAKECINLAFLFFNVSRENQDKIMERWGLEGHPPLSSYSPYAAFVLTIEIFFQVALATNLISGKRPSNRIDIAYLFYLPFCMLFVSSDKLHQKCAPLFMRNDQEFVWGFDLKKDLKKLNNRYLSLPDHIKSQGIMSFANFPPEDDFLVSSLWARHLKRSPDTPEHGKTKESKIDDKKMEEIKKIAAAQPLPKNEVDFKPEDSNLLTVNRTIRAKKGSWYQVPKNLNISENNKS